MPRRRHLHTREGERERLRAEEEERQRRLLEQEEEQREERCRRNRICQQTYRRRRSVMEVESTLTEPHGSEVTIDAQNVRNFANRIANFNVPGLQVTLR